MILFWEGTRGHLPCTDDDQREVIDIFACLMEVGHTIEEACSFMLSYARGDVA